MISKNRYKLIKSLELKKNRLETGLFVAEGSKLVHDLITSGMDCEAIYATGEWIKENKNLIEFPIETILDVELKTISSLRTPQGVLALFKQKTTKFDIGTIEKSLCLALDDIQDPGNLGTIIRIADWFGIEHIFCSIGTVDVYNTKVIQATMGAIARVNIYYVDLFELFISELNNVPIYGTFLNGENIYEKSLTQNGIIVMGNEGNGINDKIAGLIKEKLLIPTYPLSRNGSESLNVATATAIVCSEFRRKTLGNQKVR